MTLVRRTTSSLSKQSALSKQSSKQSALTKQSSVELEVEEVRSSTQLECDQVYQGIKRWKAHEGAVLLPVVRKSTIEPLRNKAKPRWWKMKKGA